MKCEDHMFYLIYIQRKLHVSLLERATIQLFLKLPMLLVNLSWPKIIGFLITEKIAKQKQDSSVPRHTLFHMASFTRIFKDLR